MEEQIVKLARTILLKKGKVYQFNIAQEELAELIQEISKVHRNKGNFLALKKEIADVLNGIEYIKLALGISEEELKELQLEKLERTLKRIERGEE